MTTPLSDSDIRPGERISALPGAFDAGLYFIGRIRTPWPTRADCPHHGDLDGPVCRLEIDPRWAPALEGLARRPFLQVLYFMHLSRRDLLVQTPRSRPSPVGTFAIRSPARPNPIASARVRLETIEATTVFVRGIDCMDGTPLLDLKPEA